MTKASLLNNFSIAGPVGFDYDQRFGTGK